MTDATTSGGTPVSRRAVLKGTALVGFSAFLAACTGTRSSPSASASAAAGGGGTSPSASTAPSPTVAPSPTPKAITGPLMFANWPAYIDLAGAAAEKEEYSPGSSPTLEAFKKKYSVEVDYQEKIGDNNIFVETIKPALVAGLATGWDLMVLTDWTASKIVANWWAEPIDPENTPNAVANLRDALKGAAWDPDNTYHFPWQSGMT